MSLLDSILSQVGGNVDIASIAGKVGIDPAMAQQAVTALAAAHPQEGDTVQTAAAQSGIDPAMLTQVMSSMGGEGALGQVSQMIQAHPDVVAGISKFLDRDGDGNPLNDVLGMATSFFGKKS